MNKPDRQVTSTEPRRPSLLDATKWRCWLIPAVCGVSFSATSAVIGFHDSSDPVKTLGWVCRTDDATPLRVSMYADTPGGRKLLDTQIADKRRDDLAGVCPGGAAHAFRFSDYAANADGAALYAADTPVTIRVIAQSAEGPVELAGTPRSVSFAPVGIWDAGLVNWRWRTDHDNPLEGTQAAPLLLGDCNYATALSGAGYSIAGGGIYAVSGCRYGYITTPASNASTSEPVWPQQSF